MLLLMIIVLHFGQRDPPPAYCSIAHVHFIFSLETLTMCPLTSDIIVVENQILLCTGMY